MRRPYVRHRYLGCGSGLSAATLGTVMSDIPSGNVSPVDKPSQAILVNKNVINGTMYKGRRIITMLTKQEQTFENCIAFPFFLCYNYNII